MYPKIILILSCLLAVMADVLLVISAKKISVLLFIASMILLNISALIWVYSMKKGIESATAIVVYSLLTTIGCSFVGYFLFKERLSTANIVGSVLGVIALLLIISDN